MPIRQSIGQLKMHTITSTGSEAEPFTYAYVRVLPGCWNEERMQGRIERWREGEGELQRERNINL